MPKSTARRMSFNSFLAILSSLDKTSKTEVRKWLKADFCTDSKYDTCPIKAVFRKVKNININSLDVGENIYDRLGICEKLGEAIVHAADGDADIKYGNRNVRKALLLAVGLNPDKYL